MNADNGWQPISTAPRTRGVEILICGGTFMDDDDWTGTAYPFGGYAIVSFVDGYVAEDHAWQGQPCHSQDEYRYHKPTHWQPLPAAPDPTPALNSSGAMV